MFSPPQSDPLAHHRSALGRADLILGAFDSTHTSLSMLGITARTRLPKTTVHRTIEKMVELGWLTHDQGRYRLGNRLFELAGLSGLQTFLRSVALPYLADLYASTKQTVHLAVLDRGQVLYIDKINGQRPTTALTRVGGRMPAHCTAVGKVLVAHAEPAVRERVLQRVLEPCTTATIVSSQRLEQELDRTVAEGLAFDREESAVGLSCVAAPVILTDGGCVAAISVATLDSRVRLSRFALAVHDASAGVTRAMLA